MGSNPKRLKLKAAANEDLDKAIYKWFLSARNSNIPISGQILKEKATQYARELEIENFQASNGWIERWKARYGISFKTVSGEMASCTPEMTASWSETLLPTILSQYKLEDIYNADEFGLFYQALPSKSLHLKSEKCIGGKISRVRLTGLAAASATGEKLPMFVIGQSTKPRCFTGVKSLPCRYRAETKSWMDGVLLRNG